MKEEFYLKFGKKTLDQRRFEVENPTPEEEKKEWEREEKIRNITNSSR